jgi:ubiquinone/menaquinone biosynthesis C-methylase UbiE
VNYLFVDDQRARLEAAEDLMDDGTIRVLERLGTRSGWRCLEVGAGGGSIARWLAERVAPLGHVVATDINTRDLKTSGHATLEVRQHDIVADPIEEAAFDLVHARLVLEHLRERDQVLDKLARALRPGGWLVVEDVDYVSAIPISDAGAREHQHTQSVRLQAFSGRLWQIRHRRRRGVRGLRAMSGWSLGGPRLSGPCQQFATIPDRW